ncbi:MAG TPA: aldehyde dehydrogenase family protein, partial [Sphingobacteriaceae bacterium]|nr:aldehyde dehydrogenase family protein [Sphingobacteriaceae bacterium]
MENIQDILKSAAKATTVVQALSEEVKVSLLKELSARLKNSKKEILASNLLDLNKMDDADPKKDRLVLTDARIDDLSSSLDEIAALPDPANQVIVERTLDNGLQVIKKTVPLGVVGVIYESRPNVTIDVAALCIRSGNVCLLRGGSDAFHTNTILVELIHQCLDRFNIDRAIVQLLPVDRRFVDELLNASKYVDIIIPRGSDQL